MPQEVQAFFDGYRDAFNRFDGEAVAAHFELPTMIAHAEGVGVFTDTPALIANFAALCAHYQRDGMQRADYTETHWLPQGPDFGIADLTWRLQRADKPEQCFGTTYQIARRAGAWKVVFVTAYSETRPQ